MVPNPHVIPSLPTPRYATVVPPNGNGGEKRLVYAALMESCTIQPDKTPHTTAKEVFQR